MSHFISVSSLQFEVPLDDLLGFQADAILGDSVFEVLIEPRDLTKHEIRISQVIARNALRQSV